LYRNVPSVLKVRDCVVLDTVGMFAGAPVAASKSTLCGTDSNVQVTVPPRTMFTSPGENWRFLPAVTLAFVAGITLTPKLTDAVAPAVTATDFVALSLPRLKPCGSCKVSV
jgi:hypothetical protein